MTEASSNTMTAGPTFGGGAASNKDIVNGLDGLRLLIERRQNEVKTDEKNVEQGRPRLTEENTILAITGKRPQVYVLDGDKLRVFNSESVGGNADRLNAAVNRLDADNFLIRRNRAVAGQRMLINKAMADELSVVDGGVVYRDYLLKLNSSAVDVVKAMLVQRPKKMKMTQKREEVSSNKIAKVKTPRQDDQSLTDTAGLLDKVTKVKQITDRTAKSEATPRDAMELFLTLGQASPKILRNLLSISDEEAASIIDSLRRMGGIGERNDDDAYPILIDSVDKLADSDNAEKLLASFRAAVHTEEINSIKLTYDLDEVSCIDWADEFVRSVADYARASQNPRIEQLFNGENKQVKTSRIFRTLSDDNGRVDFADLNLFNDIVMGSVLTNNMVSVNPTDGFPWTILQVSATDRLRESVLRYLAANIEWIEAVLSEQQLESLARQIANITFDKATDQRRNLQKVISLRYAAVVDAMRIESDVADGQQKISLK